MNGRVGTWRAAARIAVGVLVLGLLPAVAGAQQPPFEGAVSPEPLKPREQLAPPNLEGAEGILFALHRGVSLALAPLLELGVENGLLGTGGGSIGGLKIRPGSLGPGSGVGLQVGYVYFEEPFWAGVSAGASLKGYQEHSAFIGVRDARGTSFLRGTATYDLDTEDDFSGLGMNTPEDNDSDIVPADYRQEEIRLLGDGQYSLAERFRVGARGGYRKNNLRGGENDNFLDIQDPEAFGDSVIPGVGILPGLFEEGEYAQFGGFLAYDTRNDPRNPDRGLVVGGSADVFSGISETPFDWTRFAGEFAGYLPLPDETRVIAVRLLGIHQEPDEAGEDDDGEDDDADQDGTVVPFYYLSSLGGGSMLRSYSSFRFQDNDLLYGAVEFRRRVWTEEAGQAALDASLFAESGGVYRDVLENVEFGDMQQSFGTELRVLVPNDVIARLGVAFGDEGAKVYVGGGGRF